MKKIFVSKLSIVASMTLALVSACGSPATLGAEASAPNAESESTPLMPLKQNKDGSIGTMEADVLTLHGAGDLSATNNFLKAHGLEAIPQNGGAQVSISIAEFTKLKPKLVKKYHELFVTIYARRIGDTSGAANYAFSTFLLDSKKMQHKYEATWAIESELGSFELALANDGSKAAAEDDYGYQLVAMSMASGQPTQTVPFALDSRSFVVNHAAWKVSDAPSYHTISKGFAFVRPFDASKGDVFENDQKTTFGAVLAELKYVPVVWFNQKDVAIRLWSLD